MTSIWWDPDRVCALAITPEIDLAATKFVKHFRTTAVFTAAEYAWQFSCRGLETFTSGAKVQKGDSWDISRDTLPFRFPSSVATRP